MCNIIDGKCSLADKYPGNHYHNNPSLEYQIDGEIISFQSSIKEIKADDINYGYKVHSLRISTVNRIIEICSRMMTEEANKWWSKK